MFKRIGRYTVTIASVFVLVGPVGPAGAATYLEIASWATINSGGASTSDFAAVIEGETAYFQLTLSSAPRITKVESLDGPQAQTVLVSTPQWTGAGGTTSLVAYYGFSISGDYLQFSDSSTDAIWRVRKDTGAITQYVSKAQVGAVVGTTADLLAPADTTPTGEFVVYEKNSKNILITSGTGSISKLVTTADLAGLQGTAGVDGGLTYDAAGSLYWGYNSGGIYKRAGDGTLSQVLSASTIAGAIGGGASSVSFKDIYAAPDGRIYFQDNISKNVLRFDVANPVGTLANYLTGADLTAGPATSGSIGQLTWYGGHLAFNVQGAKGLYAVPEPATVGLLALGAIPCGVLRRSRGIPRTLRRG